MSVDMVVASNIYHGLYGIHFGLKGTTMLWLWGR